MMDSKSHTKTENMTSEKEWKLPPRAKIYEALSAVGDRRVEISGPGKAVVASSNRTKTYLVQWSEDLTRISSNDNASYWQGYLGYPIIATLCILGRIHFNPEVAGLLSGVNWKDVNTKFKNNYDRAIDNVLQSLQLTDVLVRSVEDEVDSIMAQLEKLPLEKLPVRLRPPK